MIFPKGNSSHHVERMGEFLQSVVKIINFLLHLLSCTVIIKQEKSLSGGTHKMENTTSAASPITGHTGLICLLGSPCAHSVSPMMHNASFEALGLDYRYLAFDVNEETLPTAVAGLKVLGARGFNLTMPDKNLMVSLCDELSTAARIIGAVNTVSSAITPTASATCSP